MPSVKITLRIGSYLNLLKSNFGSFDLEIDVLTLKVTWNHEKSKVHEKRGITLAPR